VSVTPTKRAVAEHREGCISLAEKPGAAADRADSHTAALRKRHAIRMIADTGSRN
jgi:hypothetical protein